MSKVSRFAAAAIISVLSLAQIPASRGQNGSGQPDITGTWRGNSECAVKNSPCHDEINVYRFSVTASRPGWFSGDGSKVVDDKEISMGELDWRYDAASRVLQSNTPNGVFRLVVEADRMEGTLVQPDGTVYRRIHLAKVK